MGNGEEDSGQDSSSKQDYRHALATELIKASPRLLIAIFVLIVVISLQDPISAFLDRSTKIGIGPVSLEAAEVKLKQVKVEAGDAPYFSQVQIDELTERFSNALSDGRKAQVIWVDDNPQNNMALVDFLELFSVNVEVSRTTSDALSLTQERSFNAVVSDYSRPNDPVEIEAASNGAEYWGAGAQLAKKLADSGCGRKVIIFSSESTDDRPVPPGAYSATNNYYRLLVDLSNLLEEDRTSCFT